MRIESSVTAISWIPSEAIEGMPKLPFELGIAHYDEPPPEHLERRPRRLRAEDRFREANELAAWIEVEDGRSSATGYEGSGLVGSTTFRLGIKDVTFPASPSRSCGPSPRSSDDSVRFVQTVGGRAGFPAPRGWSGRPFVRIHSRDGLDDARAHDPRRRHLGARARRREPFPRHWIYDRDGQPRREVRARSTSRPGTGRRTATARRGATRSRRRS